MKKYIAFLLFTIACTTVQAQSIDRLFKRYSGYKEVNRVTVGPLLMKLGSFFTETMGIHSIEVLELDNCEASLKERFHTEVRELKDPKFETMVSNNEAGERVRILVNIDKEMIRELVVLTSEKSNVMVRLRGKIKPSDWEKVARKHKNNGC